MTLVNDFKPDFILSVAHGSLFKTAAKVSGKTGIPLILLAQDWWPAFPEVNAKKRHKEEREFIAICSSSEVTIAVSEGM